MKIKPKDKKFIDKYIENGNNATKAVKDIYGITNDNYARLKAHRKMKQKSIQNAIKSIADSIPDELLIEKHLQLLRKTDDKGEVDVNAVKSGLDMAYKIKSTYAPEKIKLSGEVRFGELENLSNEELEKLANESEE